MPASLPWGLTTEGPPLVSEPCDILEAMPGEHASTPIDLAREPQFVLAGVRVNPATLEILGDAGRDVLEPRVMQVLVALARRAGEVVARDELIASCWGGRIVGDDAINSCVAKVRRVGDRRAAYRIETIPRVGYRLAPAQAPQAPPVPAWSGKPSIAVLPFANLSDDPGRDYFADGMVEDIAIALTRFRSLFVIAGGSGLSLKGQVLTPQEAGRRLGVRYLLDGTVRRAADRVRISVSLIDARDGVQLWAERFEGAMTDIFALQDEVALSVAAKIVPQVYREEVRRAQAKPLADLDAYDYFLRARAVSAHTREAVQQALPLYERCLELEPRNARALASCAECLAMEVALGSADEDRLRAQARQRIQAALRLAPDDAEVLAVTAGALMNLQEDHSTARALADHALAVNPGYVLGWLVSGWLRAFTEPDIAVEHFEHCFRLDPLSGRSAGTLTGLGIARMRQRRIEDAMALFHQSARLSPDYPTNYGMVAACHAHLGQFAEAREAVARLEVTSGRNVREWAERMGWGFMTSQLARIEGDGQAID
jgi:TolB-like protein/Tfp pilus assembly protein PilF